MKRDLWPVICSAIFAAAPSMAQEPYPAYAYPSGTANEQPGYDTNRDIREFRFNPNDMFDRMTDPMGGMFGSSRRRYDAYPEHRYAPPAYPPAYGYPAYPAYQAPPNNGYAAPAYPGYANPHGYQPAAPAQPAAPQPPTAGNPPGYDRAPPAPMQGQAPPAPGYSERYTFRPMENPPSTQGTPVTEPAVPAQAPPPNPPAYAEQPPPAQTDRSEHTRQSVHTPASIPDTVMHEGHALKFRPLDKPGYPPVSQE